MDRDRSAQSPCEGVVSPQTIAQVQSYLARRWAGGPPCVDPADAAAWASFHRACQPRIVRLVRAVGVPPDQCDDCVQEAWGRVLMGLARYRPGPVRFEAWLRVVVLHAAAAQRRRSGRRRERLTAPLLRALASRDEGPAAAYERTRRVLQVRAACEELAAALPPLDAQGLILRGLREQSAAAVAAALGLTAGQVRLWFHRLARRLRERLARAESI